MGERNQRWKTRCIGGFIDRVLTKDVALFCPVLARYLLLKNKRSSLKVGTYFITYSEGTGHNHNWLCFVFTSNKKGVL